MEAEGIQEFVPPTAEFAELVRSSLRATFSAADNEQLLVAQNHLQSIIDKPQFQQVLVTAITDQSDQHLQAAASSFLKLLFQRDCMTAVKVFELPNLSGKLAKNIALSLRISIGQLSAEIKWMLLESIFSHHTDSPQAGNRLALASSLVSSVDCQRENVERIVKVYFEKVVQVAEELAGRAEQLILGITTESAQGMLAEVLIGIQNSLGVFDAIIELTAQDEQLEHLVLDGLVSNKRFGGLVVRLLQLPSNSPGVLLIPHPQLESATQLNCLKSMVMHLSHEVHQDPLKQVFNDCYQTLLANNSTSVQTREETSLMADVISTIERYSLEKRVNSFFTENKLQLVMACLQYCVADQFELQMSVDNPTTFVELASDFCDSQDLQSPKTRIASLIASLCHGIDGFLSYLVEVILKLMMGTCQTLQPSNNASPNFYVRTFQINPTNQLTMESIKMFPYSQLPPLSIIESSLLVLASIIDQLERRNDIIETVMQQVQKMPIRCFDDVAACRYILLASFLNHKGLLLQMVDTCCSGSMSPVVEEQTYDGLIRLLDRLKHKSKHSQEGKLVRVLSSRLLEGLSCWSRAYELVIDRKTWSNDNLQFVETLFERFVQQLDEMLVDEHRLERSCLNMCHLISQIEAKSIDEELQPYLHMMAEKLLPISANNNHFINIMVNWMDRAKQFTPETEELVIRLLSINCYGELMNRYIFYSSEINPQLATTHAIITKLLENLHRARTTEQVYESAAILELLVLKLAIPHPELLRVAQQVILKYKHIAQLPLTFPKLNNVLMAIYYRFPREAEQMLGGIYCSLKASFFHKTIIEAVGLISKLSIKVYVIYLMHLAVFEGTVFNGNPEEVLALVVNLLEKMEDSRWQAGNNPYTNSIPELPHLLLKEQSLRHPFSQINELELFRRTWQQLITKIPELRESGKLNKGRVLELLQQQKVGEQARTVVRIKRN